MPVFLSKYVFLSIVPLGLLVVAGTCTSQECLYGFLTELAALPGGSGSQPHLLGGSYLFPNITIQCYGRVTSVRFSGYFNPDVRYNSTLILQFQFYTQTGSQYMLATSVNLELNLEAFSRTQPGLMTDFSGRYYVSSPLVLSLYSTLYAPMQVSPGYVLGIGLPPTESLPSGVVAHGLSIVVQDDTSSPTIGISQDSCWNPSLMRTEPCSVIREQVRPVFLLEFTEEASVSTTAPTSTASVPPAAPSSTPVPQPSDAISPSQIGLSSYYTAAGMAGLFAFLFLLAALIVLVLVCAVVAVSRRHSKSIASNATELEPSQQAVSTMVSQNNAKLGYETMHPAGSGSAFGFQPKAVYEAMMGSHQPEARCEEPDYSTRDRPPAVYNHLHRPTSPAHAEYSIPRGAPPPQDYEQLSVQTQYINTGQSCGQPPSSETAPDTGPYGYAMVLP